MAKRRKRGTPKSTGSNPPSHVLGAAEFKARCLELMDRVRETRAEYVVTKHGTPVARLVPYAPSERPSFFGSAKGTVLQYDRPFDPVEGEYDINHE